MLAKSSALLLFLLSTHGLAQVTFLTQPQNATVVEGGNVYNILSNQTTTVLEGEDITYSFGFEANPSPTNFTWSRDGQVISSGGRIATSVSTISITISTRSDSRVYEVVSYNEAGRGTLNFTLDVQYTAPVIGTVDAKALSLSDVQVTVTLSDTGGQPVVECTVTINGTVMTYSGSAGLHIWNVTGLSLMNGVTYNVSVVAKNSVGASETCTRSFSVPFPPNITMQPVAVTPDETTTRCCAGVRVFLEDPSDPTLVFTAQVSTDGSPFTARNITREGDVVYVQGLQAGTPYNIRLTGRNNFGSVTKKVSSTPLIGSPSDPSMPVVSVEGSSVSIQLSTRYPGTNARGQFRLSLIFSAASTAKRQSLQPIEVRVDPTGLDSSVTTTHTLTDVEAGKYSVSVMAENEYGMSQDVTATFVVEGSCPGSTDQTPTVVALSVVLVVVVVLLAVAIPTIILLYTRNQKLSSILKAVKDPNYHYDDVEMESHNHPKSHSKSTTEPQYEECGGGVTSRNVAMEENPAYQSVDVAAAKP